MTKFVDSVRLLVGGLSGAEEAKARACYNKGWNAKQAAAYIKDGRVS